jgi:hypothetical protein
MSDFQPAHTFNLLTGSPLAFRNVILAFERWRREQPKTPFTLTTGWHAITPHLAEELLQRNFKNRTVHFPTVVAYAVQLVNGQWKKTGQPLIFTDDEELLDGQHRLWACYLTGRSFETFVITGVEHQEMLFAYVDNSKPRTAGDALETAGINGLSRHVAAVINGLAHRYDQKALVVSGRVNVGKLSNHEVLGYMTDHPELMEAAKYVEQNYKTAKTRLGPEIATFMAWRIGEIGGGTEPIDEFLIAMTANDLPTGHPVKLLRALLNPDLPGFAKKGTKAEQAALARITARVKVTKMGLNLALAFAITAFNHMQQGELMIDKLILDPSGPVPEIELADPVAAEVEAEAKTIVEVDLPQVEAALV